MATQTDTSVFTFDPRTGIHWAAVALAAVTGAIHLFFGVEEMAEEPTMAVLFLLAGLGFFGGIAVFLAEYWRRAFYLVATAFTAIQIVAWFFAGGFEAFAYADKVIQVVYVLLVLSLYCEAGT